jgi:3-dehydroquinate synthase
VRCGLFEDTLREYCSDVALADERFASILTAGGLRAVTLQASEPAKSLDEMPTVITALRRLGATRQTRLLAVGGGVVQDIASFVASVYMRGLQWAYIPTTLLSMCDSCIGGKSSINVGPYKNLVGTFHPPYAIMIDPKLASTLSPEQTVSGLVEACKICYCRGTAAFQEYLALSPSSSMSADQIEQIVLLSLASKKWFIEIDEFDRAQRLLLNFGHTFGHALEGASHFDISHGIAVGVGMLCAIRFGELMGRTYPQRSRGHILAAHTRELLRDVPELTEQLISLSIQDALDRFAADKKHSSETYSVVVVAESGDVELLQVPRSAEVVKLIETSIRDVVGLHVTGALARRKN